MSRNLLKTECDVCEAEVELTEAPRKITAEEAGVYYEEYRGMTVADARCTRCEARYLAWVEPPPGEDETTAGGGPFYDLSYRSTFNDEPGDEDVKYCDENLQLKEAKEREKRLQKLRDEARKRISDLGERGLRLVISLLDVLEDLR